MSNAQEKRNTTRKNKAKIYTNSKHSRKMNIINFRSEHRKPNKRCEMNNKEKKVLRTKLQKAQKTYTILA